MRPLECRSNYTRFQLMSIISLVPSASRTLKAFVIYPVIRLKHVRANLTISYINVTKLTTSLRLSVIYLVPKTDSSIIKSELDRVCPE